MDQKRIIIVGGQRSGIASMIKAASNPRVFTELPPRSQQFLRDLGETAESFNRGQERDQAAKQKRARRIERNLRNEARQDRAPEGLYLYGDTWLATCKTCRNDYELPCEAAEFDPGMSYCGRNEWCLP
jgi:hypothetical protein